MHFFFCGEGCQFSFAEFENFFEEFRDVGSWKKTEEKEGWML
jgi:hypothetical protein